MAYEVLYRKYRPRDFAGLVGQEHVRKALEHALEHDRLHHAYLFTGTRGVGKTTIARILARCLNCEVGVGLHPCGVCASCMEIDSGRFIDLIEVDAASRTKVEDTRELLDNVQYPPVRGRYKVYLIDEVHMLSNSSFNALLKTLEEPPPRVVFLLATTEPKRLPVTVLSRCLQFSLKSYRPEQISGHLRDVLQKEAISFDEGAIRLIARAARGSMRDALSLSDQAIAHGGGSLSASAVELLLGTIDLNELARLGRAVADGDAAGLLAVSAALADAGADFDAALQRLSALWHAVAVVQAGVPLADDSDESALATELGQRLDPELTQLLYQISVIGLRDLQLAPEPRIGFEMALLRMLAFAPLAAPAASPQLPTGSKASGADVRQQAVRNTSAGRAAAALPASPVSTNASMTTTTSAPPRATTSNVGAEGAESAHRTASGSAPVLASADAPQPARMSPQTWLESATTLRLTGIARDIALNLVPRQLEGPVWDFELDSGRMSLLSDEHVEAIVQAIATRFGSSPSLNISPAVRGGDTAAAKLAREEGERRATLLASVRADPVVRALQDRFGASIDESTLRPN